MATLILTAAGTAIAGPLGGAVGAIIGQAADQAIFAPRARHGPRLGDRAVQTSAYGSELPRIFGRMRVAGTVIWATDLIETRAASGGGKGRPKTVNYSYSASFAVALSARKLLAVHRIWAEGKLLRGAAGDFKTQTGFRLYTGGEDQPVDPLIAAAEGLALAPAFRGLAYAVFEELQLEDYGNRIPSLTFEVEADPEPVGLGSIAAELSDGIVAGGSAVTVHGYAASGDSVRSAIEGLSDVVPLVLADGVEGLVLVPPAAPAVELAATQLSGPVEILRRASGGLPGEVALAYYDSGRDYQAGLQRALRDGPSPRSDRRSLAAALDATHAKELAEARLAAAWSARSSARVRLGWRQLRLKPGATVSLEGQAGLWRVDRWLLGPMTLDLELTRVAAGSTAAAPATAGRSVADRDLVHGPTVLRLVDVPLPVEREGLWLFALAAGPSEGWRRALLSASFDGGASWDDVGPTAHPAILGRTLSALGVAPAALIDDTGRLDVELLHDEMWLEGRSDAALAGGANLALVGSELVQFGRAERLGERRFRLSRMLRGRRGTEWAISGHVAQENFALIRSSDVLALEAPPGVVAAEAGLNATGIGDGPEGVAASCTISGETLRPPSPVHLHVRADPNGDISIGWTRRSRAGWTWPSGSDTPLGEEAERYRVTLASGSAARTFEVGAPSLLYSAAQQEQDQIGPPLSVEVVQVGTHSTSRPAQLMFG